jgi:DNA-binding LacI/PurR family transcriptional regulator
MTDDASGSKRSLTMAEIAHRLGVSIATVSRALNDQPGVSPDLRQRVLTLSAELDYAPHGGARGLATTQTHTVAFLTLHRSLPLDEDYFYQRIMLGAQQELARHGYYLLVSVLEPDQVNDLANLRLLRERRVDGAILAGPEIPPRSILALQGKRVPLVLVDNTLPHSPMDCVLSEDEAGGYAATCHLLDHGHTRTVMLSGPEEWPSNRARLAGYRQAMAERGLPPLEVHGSETTVDSGQRTMQDALAQYADLSAVFAANDSMAMGAIRAARALGRNPPDDLAVIGFDDLDWAEHTAPPLTTVKVYKRRMGALAARRLVELLGGESETPIRSTVATSLIIRASCGCAG